MAIKNEEMKELLDIVKVEAEKNPFTKVVKHISEILSDDSEELDVDRIVETIEKESGFDSDPNLVIGFLSSFNRIQPRIVIRKSFAKGNYI